MDIKIATRGSKLALWQANDFASLISKHIPGAAPLIVPVMTDGDRIQDRPLHEVEGKTLFIKEVENALLAGKANVAVHCVKDYHPETPPEFRIAAYLPRESDRDLLVTNTPVSSLDELPDGAVVGTTSQRRIFFLKKRRPDLQIKMLRGNIDSRLRKLNAGDYDAIVLAQAGINRLGIEPGHFVVLDDDTMLPAVGQGALVVEVCTSNPEMADLLKQFNDTPTQVCVEAERALVSGLSANCKSAVGANCRFTDTGKITLCGHVGHPGTLEEMSDIRTGNADQAIELGKAMAAGFIARGAARLLDE